jgi:hypothetical protein
VGHVLGDYIASWSSLTTDKVTGTGAKVTLPGVVTIATQPVRGTTGAPDPSSGVSVTVGAVSCSAEDAR